MPDANGVVHGLAELQGVVDFAGGKPARPRREGILGKVHLGRPTHWGLAMDVYSIEAKPFQTQFTVPAVGPRPSAGQETWVTGWGDAFGRTRLDLDAIYRRNVKVAETVPEVAALLREAGDQAKQWAAVLPGGPPVEKPVWTPQAEGSAPEIAVAPVTPTVLQCPNCGAPLQLTPSGTCQWCKVPIHV